MPKRQPDDHDLLRRLEAERRRDVPPPPIRRTGAVDPEANRAALEAAIGVGRRRDRA